VFPTQRRLPNDKPIDLSLAVYHDMYQREVKPCHSLRRRGYL